MKAKLKANYAVFSELELSYISLLPCVLSQTRVEVLLSLSETGSLKLHHLKISLHSLYATILKMH